MLHFRLGALLLVKGLLYVYTIEEIHVTIYLPIISEDHPIEIPMFDRNYSLTCLYIGRVESICAIFV